MTYPLRTISDLEKAMTPAEYTTPIVIVTRDGTRWQVDGVELMVDEFENQVEFQLRVGPPDAS